MAKKNRQPWYKNGLQFECTQCGDCCSGSPGLVQFTAGEGTEMAASLGLTETEFYELYATKSPDGQYYELYDVYREGFGFDCILLDRCPDTGKTSCRAHTGRPLQCRTWPFWPDNIVTERAWKKAAKDCEGIGRGGIIPLRVIQQEADLTPEWGIVLDLEDLDGLIDDTP